MLLPTKKMAKPANTRNPFGFVADNMNPKNWGVNDYSDRPTFNNAFADARRNKEPEFLFKGDRYANQLANSKNYDAGKRFVADEIKSRRAFSPADSSTIDYRVSQRSRNVPRADSLNSEYQRVGREQDAAINAFQFDKSDQLAQHRQQLAAGELEARYGRKAQPSDYDSARAGVQQRGLNRLNKPVYTSITSQKGKLSEDGYWDPKKKALFISDNGTADSETTAVHELTHKAGGIARTTPKEEVGFLSGLEGRIKNNTTKEFSDVKGYDYVSNQSELGARHNSAKFWLQQHHGYKVGQPVTSEHLQSMRQNKKLPYDIGQMLELYGDDKTALRRLNTPLDAFAKGGLLPGKVVPAAESTGTRMTPTFAGYSPPLQKSIATQQKERTSLTNLYDNGYRTALTTAGYVAGGVPGMLLQGADTALDAKDAYAEMRAGTGGTGQLATGLTALELGTKAVGHVPIARFMRVLSDAAGQFPYEPTKPAAKKWGQPRVASRKDGGLLPGKLTMLGPDGKAQMELGGGNRIFSRKDTRELVSRSLKAKTPAELKELGGRIRQMLDKQDGNKPEYVSE